MYLDNTCKTQCKVAGRTGGKLVTDGDVCPFQYFCECICPHCVEKCAAEGKVHVNKSVDIFGCNICNCQCEKINCVMESISKSITAHLAVQYVNVSVLISTVM